MSKKDKAKLMETLDGSLDVSLGIISALILANLYSCDVTWKWLLLGAFFNWAPDLDGVWFLLQTKKNGMHNLYKHRTWMHHPLKYLFLFGLPLFLFASKTTLALFVLCSCNHFIHDTFVHGWGIEWLNPFSTKRIALFHHTRPERPVPWLWLFPAEQLHAIRTEYRDHCWWNVFTKYPSILYAILCIDAIALWLLFQSTFT